MNKIKVRFTKAGTWGDEPKDPVFDVKVGDIKALTPRVANLAVSAGKAEYYVAKPEKVVPVVQVVPVVTDKPVAGPIPKAEGKKKAKKGKSKKAKK